MNRRLSSIITPFYKAFPFILMPYCLFWFISDLRYDKLGEIIFMSLFCGIWFLVTFRWKSAYLKGDVLSVSNYLKRVEIPLTDIENVEASSWWGWQPRTIKLRLKAPSELGVTVVFVPRLGGLEADKIADELRDSVVSHK